MQIEYLDVDRERTSIGELKLRSYRAESGETGYEILLDDNFLMASHGSHAERAMAQLACTHLREPFEELRILVGGLGAGHTLRAALDLAHTRQVVVVEIGAKVAEWNRRFFAEVNGHAVDDPRVEVLVADLAAVLAASDGDFHLALLDVDNGPGWLASESNTGLYEPQGLETCRKALIPGGVLAVWSPKPNNVFFTTMARVFDRVESLDTAALGLADGEPGSTVYIGVA